MTNWKCGECGGESPRLFKWSSLWRCPWCGNELWKPAQAGELNSIERQVIDNDE